MSDKKKFKDTTVGKLLFGAASIVNPTLGSVLQGVTSPKEAIAEIGKANIPNEEKIKLQQLIFEQESIEMKEVSSRWLSDNQGSWLSRNVRPIVLLFLIVSTIVLIFIDAGFINFDVKDSYVDLLQLTLITTISAYFGGRSFEKIKK
tara:strand:- start:798 stop:1238 length:441 start_codon:yes stop_codon:yes gene_type:complete